MSVEGLGQDSVDFDIALEEKKRKADEKSALSTLIQDFTATNKTALGQNLISDNKTTNASQLASRSQNAQLTTEEFNRLNFASPAEYMPKWGGDGNIPALKDITEKKQPAENNSGLRAMWAQGIQKVQDSFSVKSLGDYNGSKDELKGKLGMGLAMAAPSLTPDQSKLAKTFGTELLHPILTQSNQGNKTNYLSKLDDVLKSDSKQKTGELLKLTAQAYGQLTPQERDAAFDSLKTTFNENKKLIGEAFPEHKELLSSVEKLGLEKKDIEKLITTDDPKKAAADLTDLAKSKIKEDRTRINDYLEVGSKLLANETINNNLRDLVNEKMKDASPEKKIAEQILNNPAELNKLKLPPAVIDALDKQEDLKETMFPQGASPAANIAALAFSAYSDPTNRLTASHQAQTTIMTGFQNTAWQKSQDAAAQGAQDAYQSILSNPRHSPYRYDEFGNKNYNGLEAWGISMGIGHDKVWSQANSKAYSQANGEYQASVAQTQNNLADDFPKVGLTFLPSDQKFNDMVFANKDGSSKPGSLNFDRSTIEKDKMSHEAAKTYLSSYADRNPNGTLSKEEQNKVGIALLSLDKQKSESEMKTHLEANAHEFIPGRKAQATDFNGDMNKFLTGVSNARQMFLNSRNFDISEVKAAKDQSDQVIAKHIAETAPKLGMSIEDLKGLTSKIEDPQIAQSVNSLLDKAKSYALPKGFTTDTVENIYKNDKALMSEAGDKFAFYRDADNKIISFSKNSTWSGKWNESTKNWDKLDSSIETNLRSNLALNSTQQYTNPRKVEQEEIQEKSQAYQDWYKKASVDFDIGKVTDANGNHLIAAVRKDGSTEPQVHIPGKGWQKLDSTMAARLKMPEMSEEQASAQFKESLAGNRFAKPFDAKKDKELDTINQQRANSFGYSQQYQYQPLQTNYQSQTTNISYSQRASAKARAFGKPTAYGG